MPHIKGRNLHFWYLYETLISIYLQITNTQKYKLKISTQGKKGYYFNIINVLIKMK